MPVLFQVSIEVNSGSVGRIAEQIGEVAMSYGWESYITYARNHLPSKSQTIKIGNKFDIYWHGMMTRLFDRHCLSSTRATKRLIEQIEAIKPDIIQLHHIHGYFLNMRVLFAYLSSIDTPVVWIFHDCWAMTGHCSYFDYVGCEKWKNECYCCPLKDNYPASLGLFDRSRSNYKLKKELFTAIQNLTLVPVSNWLEGIVKESFFKNYSNIKIHTIYNGVDTNIFKYQTVLATIGIRNKYGIVDTDLMAIACATTWEERKGLKDYVALSKKIDSTVKLVMVGVNKNIRETLPNNIIALSRTESVYELATLYSAADVVLNLSYEETFGLTTVEGFACGTPAIVYNVTASPELISEETGFVVEKGDIDGVVIAIDKVAAIGKNFYSKACRDRALTFFDSKIQYHKYIELYNSLISKNYETVF